MIELLLIFKSSSLFSDYYLTILSYDNNHQITTSEVDLQLDKKPTFLLVVNGHYAFIFNLGRYLLYFKLVNCDFFHTIVERRVWRITHDFTIILKCVNCNCFCYKTDYNISGIFFWFSTDFQKM